MRDRLGAQAANDDRVCAEIACVPGKSVRLMLLVGEHQPLAHRRMAESVNKEDPWL